MLDKLRRRITDMVIQYSHIAKTANIHDSAYYSGTSIYGDVHVDEGCKIFRSHIQGNVKIGRFTSLWGPGIHIIGRVHGISIGNFCSLARYVSVLEDLHNIQRTTSYFIERNLLDVPESDACLTSKGKIAIGHDVWIGAAAQILSGVTIGHGAVIGAGAIVTKDVPPYAIVVGNPARIARYRFSSETIQELLDSAWWDWPLSKILENEQFLLKIRE